MDFKLGSKAIDIPAGDADYAVEDRFVLPVGVDLLSVYPHAHYLARRMTASATLPDGRVQSAPLPSGSGTSTGRTSTATRRPLRSRRGHGSR